MRKTVRTDAGVEGSIPMMVCWACYAFLGCSVKMTRRGTDTSS